MPFAVAYIEDGFLQKRVFKNEDDAARFRSILLSSASVTRVYKIIET